MAGGLITGGRGGGGTFSKGALAVKLEVGGVEIGATRHRADVDLALDGAARRPGGTPRKRDPSQSGCLCGCVVRPADTKRSEILKDPEEIKEVGGLSCSGVDPPRVLVEGDTVSA